MVNSKCVCLGLLAFILLVIIFKQSNMMKYESFQDPTPAPTNNVGATNYLPPTDFKIEKIGISSVDISFDTPVAPTAVDVDTMPLYYTIIISSYKSDDLSKSAGGFTLDFKDTRNLEMNCKANDTQTEKCTFTFDIEKYEVDGVKLYHRLGLLAIYKGGHSSIVDPWNIRIFRLGRSLNYQLRLLREGEKVVEGKPDPQPELDDTEDIVAMADGKYQLIKQKLGGYPDNLFLSQQTGPTSLAELAQRQLALGILDVSVHTKNLV